MKKIAIWFGLLIFICLAGSATAAELLFTSGGSFEAGCPATINVILETNGQAAGAVDAIMKFDPSKIIVQRIQPGTLFKSYLDPVIDNQAGTLKLTAYGGAFNGNGVYARITFLPRPGVTTAQLSWDFTLDSTIDSNVADRQTSMDILQFVQSGNYSFYPTDGYCADDTAGPTINNQSPAPGSINQPLDSTIAFNINDNRSGVNIETLVVTVKNGAGENQYQFNDFNYDLLTVSNLGEPRSYAISLVPAQDFIVGEPVLVEVEAADLDGNESSANWSFNHPEPTCEDLGCGAGGVCDNYLSIWATPGNHQIALNWFPEPSVLGYESVVVRRLACPAGDNFPNTPGDGVLIYEGAQTAITDANLDNDVSYCYSAFAYRQSKDGVEYSPAAFLKSSPTCYISAIRNFSLSKFDNGVQLNWENPSSGGFDSVKVIKQAGGCPSNICYEGCWGGNQVVYDGTGQEFFDAEIDNGATFCYLVFAYNRDGCSSSGLLASTGEFSWDDYPTTTDQFVPAVEYYTNNGGLEVFRADNSITLLQGKDLIIKVKNNFDKPVERIVGEVADRLYLFILSDNGEDYRLPLGALEQTGETEFLLRVVYGDGTVSTWPVSVKVMPLGRVVSKVLGIAREIADAKIFLYDSEGKLFVGANQKNPLTVDDSGRYGFMAPSGQYRLVVREGEEEKYNSAIVIAGNQIVNQEINITATEPVAQKAVELVKNIIDNPVLEESNIRYVAPTALAVTTANAAVSLPWWNLITYLRYLFTEPFAWFFRRRRRGWGVVYNSITKKPIDLAVVRLYNYQTKKLIRSQVTDKNGRYNFLVDEGQYIIEIERRGYIFPSQILKEVAEDLQYTDIYHGEVIRVSKKEEGAITANIPIDQEEVKISNSKIIRQNFWKNIKEDIGAVGPIFGVLSFLITPTILIGSFAVGHIILFLLFRRLAGRQKPKSWGVVYDLDNRKPIKNAVARIFSPQHNRMLEAQVTDKYGRYGFLVDNNAYFIVASKEGYQDNKTAVINLTHKKAEDIFGFDLWLKPETNGGLTNRPEAEGASPIKQRDQIQSGIDQPPRQFVVTS